MTKSTKYAILAEYILVSGFIFVTPTLTLLDRYDVVRAHSLNLCRPLQPEDCTVQVAPFASPLKWHLAHTSWFFEEFILVGFEDYQRFNPAYGFFFNSYYNAKGSRNPQATRGLSRPYLADIFMYREHVDAAIRGYAGRFMESEWTMLELGLHHEQQHQELILQDLKYLLGTHPLRPSYPTHRLPAWHPYPAATRPTWLEIEYGIHTVGHDPRTGFGFDNETPRHECILPDSRICSRSVTNAEYLQFILAGGYERPEFWLSDGWDWVQSQGIQAPLYWRSIQDEWHEYTLSGEAPLDPTRTLMHVSYHEAYTYAKWSGHRLPSEFELELLHDDLDNGTVWEWTSSTYTPYPGYREPDDDTGEYNAKFMSNRQVLRGGSLATPPGHARSTYRNFYHLTDRWQFSGIRLAK